MQFKNITNNMIYREDIEDIEYRRVNIKIGDNDTIAYKVVEKYIIDLRNEQNEQNEIRFIIYDKNTPLIKFEYYNDTTPIMVGYINDEKKYKCIVARLDKMYSAKYTQGLYNYAEQSVDITITGGKLFDEYFNRARFLSYDYRFRQSEKITNVTFGFLFGFTPRRNKSIAKLPSNILTVVHDATRPTRLTTHVSKINLKKNNTHPLYTGKCCFKNVKFVNLKKHYDHHAEPCILLGHTIVESYHIEIPNDKTKEHSDLFFHVCAKENPAVFIFYNYNFETQENGDYNNYDMPIIQSYITDSNECLHIATTLASIYQTKYTKGIYDIVDKVFDITFTVSQRCATEAEIEQQHANFDSTIQPVSAMQYISSTTSFEEERAELISEGLELLIYDDYVFDKQLYDNYDYRGIRNDGQYINYNTRNDIIENIDIKIK